MFATEESKKLAELENTFESEIFFDNFKIAAGENMISSNKQSKICQGILCCIMSISQTENIPSSVIFAAFRGLHTAFGKAFFSFDSNIGTSNVSLPIIKLSVSPALSRSLEKFCLC